MPNFPIEQQQQINSQLEEQQNEENDQVTVQIEQQLQERINQQETYDHVNLLNDSWCKCCNYSHCPCRTDFRNKKPDKKRRYYCLVCGKYKCNSGIRSKYMSVSGHLYNSKGKIINK